MYNVRDAVVNADSVNSIGKISVIDSHTGGEPTRAVLAGGPDLGPGPLRERLRTLRDRHDWLRTAVVREPRGSDALVGALLCEASDPSCVAGAIFFNNAGYLGMCGHGAIGLAVTLAHLGRLQVGEHRLETPVGVVALQLHDRHRVSLGNVASFRHCRNLELKVPNLGKIKGDIAWGGNWFFLAEEHGQGLRLDNVHALTDCAWAIRRQLEVQGVCGPAGEPIDHVALFGPPSDPAKADSRNFVLCPGRAYDRSPCGTGTSAKLACLIEDGKLAAGDLWRQEGIAGSLFEASAAVENGRILPRITGAAYVTGESTLLLNPADPFAYGLQG